MYEVYLTPIRPPRNVLPLFPVSPNHLVNMLFASLQYAFCTRYHTPNVWHHVAGIVIRY